MVKYSLADFKNPTLLKHNCLAQTCMVSIFGQFAGYFQVFWQSSVNQKQIEMANFVNNTGFQEVDESGMVQWLMLLPTLPKSKDLRVTIR